MPLDRGKKKINWNSRNAELLKLIKNIKRNKKSEFDLIIPVSGGKDGSYVTYMCKEKYKLNPLCVTVNPPLRTQLGHSNIETFKKEKNVQLIEINLPDETHMKINKYGLMKHGRPLYGWLIAVFTAVLRVASKFNIDLIMYGEDGEAEYGGVSNLKNNALFNPSFIKEIYMSKEYYNSIKSVNLADRTWWEFPTNIDNIKMTHWSYFENWVGYYDSILNNLEPGLNEMIVHLGIDDNEMKKITSNRIAFGSKWRNLDYNIVSSPDFKASLIKNNIKLVTWREIKDILYP